MPRTTAERVAGLVGAVINDVDMTGPVDTAHLIVNDNCLASGYSDAKLELIERWLAAHFYALMDPRAQTEDADGPRQTFEPIKVDLGFNVTKYGQQAMRVDTDGSLAALNNAMNSNNNATVPIPVKPGIVSTKWLGGWDDCR